MEFGFGAGALWGTPLTNAAGQAISNPTPVQFGVLQNCQADFNFETKQLFGGNQFALAVGRGKGTVNITAKAAQMTAALYNSVIFGQALNNSGIGDVWDTTGAPVPGTPFTITPTPPTTGVWSQDLGVRKADGTAMTRVASGPTTGQYSVTAGAYLFAAADVGVIMFISYQYTFTSTVAKNMVLSNVAMGYSPTFRVDLMIPYSGKQLVMTFGAVQSTKLTIATVLDDFTIPDFAMSAFADSNGNIATLAMSE